MRTQSWPSFCWLDGSLPGFTCGKQEKGREVHGREQCMEQGGPLPQVQEKGACPQAEHGGHLKGERRGLPLLLKVSLTGRDLQSPSLTQAQTKEGGQGLRVFPLSVVNKHTDMRCSDRGIPHPAAVLPTQMMRCVV